MLNTLACKVLGHRVNRHRVWHDGVNFRTSCTRCTRSLVRDHWRGWRVCDPHGKADPVLASAPAASLPAHD